MKKWMMVAILFMLVGSANAQFSKAQLQATGLTCAMCSKAINTALEALPFVQSVKADIKSSTFHIVFKENAELQIDAIRQAVEDAGFGIGTLNLTGVFEGVEVKNDKHVKIGDKHFHFLAVDGQVLQGEKTLRLVDKDFLTAKQFRKYSQATKMKCVETGKAESCCTDAGSNTRIYHVTI